jgi:pyruvate dehydrogenase E2 component (dihydrolipoamide acetyltransferase)
MADFRMPSLGADMEAGTLVEWMVHPGSTVKRGDVIAVVETDKGAIDVEIWQSGVIDELKVEAGNTVPVGTVLATVREDGAAAAVAPAAPPPTALQPPATVTTAPSPSTRPSAPLPSTVRTAETPAHVRASPSARQLAREHGIELGALHGTGPSGAITRADVEHAACAPLSAKPTVKPAATAMRQAIAAAMTRANRDIPHYYVGTHIDVAALRAWLTRENERRPVEQRILPIVPLVKALARALTDYPELNGFYVDDAFRAAEAVHLGFAVALRGGGLIAPAIHDCDKKSLDQLQAAVVDLIRRTRSGALRSSELSDPTVTVTSLGERGVETVYGIIHPPQVALIGLGKICERPWAVDGLLGVRPILHATLAADHRVSDGHRGALFLDALATLLAAPEKL